MWPGISVLEELATPIKGRFNSLSEYPSAFIRLLCGALSTPVFTRSLFMLFVLAKKNRYQLGVDNGFIGFGFGSGHYQPRRLVVDEDVDYEDENKANNEENPDR
jgi:hypothetical protein